MFQVQIKPCNSCIYRRDSPLDIKKLEAEIKDVYGVFVTHRQCHHTSGKNPACCAGFWARYKNEFQAGQLAQRLGLVKFMNIDNLKD
jgi:hypothetical protein